MAADFARIWCGNQPMDCAFHPSRLVVSIGNISGGVETYTLEYSDVVNDVHGKEFVHATEGWEASPHDDSCRCLEYSTDGSKLVSASCDGSLAVSDSETGEEVSLSDDNDDVEFNKVLCIDANTIATGDDSGQVVLWDIRSMSAVHTWLEQTDHITDLAVHNRSHDLLATSGDGTLGVYDLSKRGLRARSEEDGDDEFLSCVVMKNRKKVLVGTQAGVLNLFSWGHWADCSDRYPGHPGAIDCLVKFDEDTLLTGAADGGVRIVSVLPNKLLGVVGTHEEDEPIERMSLSGDRRLLASVSHDHNVVLWSLAVMHDEDEAGEEAQAGAGGDGDNDEDEDDEDDDDKPKKKRRKDLGAKTSMKRGKGAKSGVNQAFFSDLLGAS